MNDKNPMKDKRIFLMMLITALALLVLLLVVSLLTPIPAWQLS